MSRKLPDQRWYLYFSSVTDTYADTWGVLDIILTSNIHSNLGTAQKFPDETSTLSTYRVTICVDISEKPAGLKILPPINNYRVFSQMLRLHRQLLRPVALGGHSLSMPLTFFAPLKFCCVQKNLYSKNKILAPQIMHFPSPNHKTWLRADDGEKKHVRQTDVTWKHESIISQQWSVVNLDLNSPLTITPTILGIPGVGCNSLTIASAVCSTHLNVTSLQCTSPEYLLFNAFNILMKLNVWNLVASKMLARKQLLNWRSVWRWPLSVNLPGKMYVQIETTMHIRYHHTPYQ